MPPLRTPTTPSLTVRSDLVFAFSVTQTIGCMVHGVGMRAGSKKKISGRANFIALGGLLPKRDIVDTKTHASTPFGPLSLYQPGLSTVREVRGPAGWFNGGLLKWRAIY